MVVSVEMEVVETVTVAGGIMDVVVTVERLVVAEVVETVDIMVTAGAVVVDTDVSMDVRVDKIVVESV